MPLGNDTVTITLCVGTKQRVFTLRASLRAATLLYKEHGNYSALATKLAAGSFSACVSIINHACTDLHELRRFKALVDDGELYVAILESQSELLRFVQILAGADPDDDKPVNTGKPLTFEEYHTRLFKLGTGWLGWTPEATWNATASEILMAYEGRVDMFKSIFGKAEEETEVDTDSADERAALNALGDLGTTRMSQVPRAA